jgi:DNA repair exonuclease SbcCD ATPase subunit
MQATAPAQAQTAAPAAKGAAKSFGGNASGGKLLTRDELRACMKMQAEMKAGTAGLERDKSELQREKDALQQEGAALKAEREALERKRTEVAAAFKAKAEGHAQRVEAFNRRAAELAELNKERGAGSRVELLRRELEQEQSGLKTADEALRQEMNELNRTNAQEAEALNARAAGHEQKVRSWNERNDAFTARVNDRGGIDERWKASCADRRYDELDEIAIEQGR